jgi:hypothetical protein
MNRPDPSLAPFVGTHDDFVAYLSELTPDERRRFVSTLPSRAQQLAASLFRIPDIRWEALPIATLAAETPPPMGRRFRVRNGSGHMIYLRSCMPDLERARCDVIGRARERWAEFGIRSVNVSALHVDERGKRAEELGGEVETDMTTIRRAL